MCIYSLHSSLCLSPQVSFTPSEFFRLCPRRLAWMTGPLWRREPCGCQPALVGRVFGVPLLSRRDFEVTVLPGENWLTFLPSGSVRQTPPYRLCSRAGLSDSLPTRAHAEGSVTPVGRPCDDRQHLVFNAGGLLRATVGMTYERGVLCEAVCTPVSL